MNRRLLLLLPLLLLAVRPPPARAGALTKTEQSSRLYTTPDAAAGGGLRFKLPGKPTGVFALLQTDVNKCYQARPDADGWLVKGLPVGKYDLVVVFDDRFYEGLQLIRGTNNLTAADRASIQTIIANSIPFFEIKAVHRAEGITGRAGKCTLVLQEVRARPVTLQSAEVRNDIQIRSLKVAFLEEVNIGWQLINTREIMRIEVGGPMTKGVIAHHYLKELGNFRVTDTIKDLGELRLN